MYNVFLVYHVNIVNFRLFSISAKDAHIDEAGNEQKRTK